MGPRTRVLIGSVAVLLAWTLGYGMGGGFRIGGNGAADDSFGDQGAGRHIPWTRERLIDSIKPIGKEPHSMSAVRFAMKLTEQLGPKDFPLALKVAEEIKDQLAGNERVFNQVALMRWAEMKPEAAAEYLKTNDKIGPEYLSDSDAFLAVWGAANPTAAIAWAKTLRADQRRGVLKQILVATGRRDLDAAIALARAHTPELLNAGTLGVNDGTLGEAFSNTLISMTLIDHDSERIARTLAPLGISNAFHLATSRWAVKNVDEAMKWALELTDEKVRTQALKAVWQGFAERDAKEAARQFAKNAADAPFIEGVSKDIATKLAWTAASWAAIWAATLQQPKARREAFEALGSHYGSIDAAAGGRWLETLPAGADRDGAIKVFIQRAKSTHPRESAEWATAIQERDDRRDALREAVETWFTKDLGTALEWLQTSPKLSDEDRRALLKKK